MIQITGTLLFDQIPKSTAQMKRVNHRTGQFFYSKAQEQTIRQYESQLIQFKPKQPIAGPVYVSVEFSYGTKDKKKQGKCKTSRPDCDNLVKTLLDCMTRLGFWEDDAQVSILRIEKGWNDRADARVDFEVREVVE